MRVEKFKATKQGNLVWLVSNTLSNVSTNKIKSILKNKDIKVDGVRVKENVVVEIGQEITVYLPESFASVDFDIVYEDYNILVVNKPQGIETVNDENTAFVDLLSQGVNQKLYAVHRLDRNTMGLVVFAKNGETKEVLDTAFKQRTIEKYYLALVYGSLAKRSAEMIAYLKKDSKNSIVQISSTKTAGFEHIQTNYNVIDEYENSSLVEVELVTGKTHQIRAHFAHIGHFVIGDEKYGDSKINKLFHRKKQCLCSYKIVFHFNNGNLKYLDGKVIELEKEKIDFVKDCKK